MNKYSFASLFALITFPLMGAFKTSNSTMEFNVNANSSVEMTLSEVGLGIGTGAVHSSLQIAGTIALDAELVSEHTILSGNSSILANTSSANLVINLPDASSYTGRQYHIKKTSKNNKLFIATTQNQDIDGARSGVRINSSTNAFYPSTSLISDGSKWLVMSGKDDLVSIDLPTPLAHFSFDAKNGEGGGQSIYGDTVGYQGKLFPSGDATLNDSPSVNRGKSITFQTGQYFTTDASNDYLLNSDFSISFWLKTSDETTARGVIGSSVGWRSTKGFNIYMKSDEKMIFARGKSSSSFHAIESTASISIDTWQHVVFAYDESATTMYIYIDGVEDSNHTLDADFVDDTINAINLSITYSGASTSNPTNSSLEMDEVRIFTSLLSSQQVLDLYEIEQ
jgi:hypothetical protein